MMNNVLNKLLLSTFFLSQIPTLFFGSTKRLNLSLLVERSTRIDFFAMYYVNCINFIILSLCLYYKEKIDKRVSLFILLMCFLDFIHLFLFAKQGFGMSKVIIAFLLFILIRYAYNKKIF